MRSEPGPTELVSTKKQKPSARRVRRARENAAKHADIIEYWSVRKDECGMGVDWAEAHERCWRCGYDAPLERCHIVPYALGGGNGPENLVLLCSQCHREAPNVTDADAIWVWLRTDVAPHYDSYWTLRGVREFEKIFGRLPFTGEGFEVYGEMSWEELKAALRPSLWDAICGSVEHYGEARRNPSTIAFMLRDVEAIVRRRKPGQLLLFPEVH